MGVDDVVTVAYGEYLLTLSPQDSCTNHFCNKKICSRNQKNAQREWASDRACIIYLLHFFIALCNIPWILMYLLFLFFRGFGFVTYADPASVDKVLANGPHELDQKLVRFSPYFYPTANVFMLSFATCYRLYRFGNRTIEKACKRDPPWLWNPGQTSPKVRNRGISGPTKRTYVFKNF